MSAIKPRMRKSAEFWGRNITVIAITDLGPPEPKTASLRSTPSSFDSESGYRVSVSLARTDDGFRRVRNARARSRNSGQRRPRFLPACLLCPHEAAVRVYGMTDARGACRGGPAEFLPHRCRKLLAE